MNTYLLIKTLHILSSVLMVGTGFGSAFYLFFTHRTRNVQAIAEVSRLVVRADTWFTAPAVVIQPLSGWYLASQAGWTLDTPWIAAALGLYVIVTAPATSAEGAVAIWEGTIRGFLRHGLIAHLIATVSISGMSDGALIDHATQSDPGVLSREIAGVDDAAMHAVSTANALRVLSVTL